MILPDVYTEAADAHDSEKNENEKNDIPADVPKQDVVSCHDICSLFLIIISFLVSGFQKRTGV